MAKMARYIIFKQDKEGFRTVIATTVSRNIRDARVYATEMYFKEVDYMNGEKLAVVRT